MKKKSIIKMINNENRFGQKKLIFVISMWCLIGVHTKILKKLKFFSVHLQTKIACIIQIAS